MIRFVAVGYELPQTDKVSMLLDGEWQRGKHGIQLKVDKFEEIVPQTVDGIRGYLASRLIKGVGPKVAACTLLFGFDRTDAFPVDVWVKRIIEKYFPAPFEAAALGSYAGLAQQYLFYYERYLGGQKD
jgi:3-methyladenine DNA glycosylase/8-oxoguanine DNA glycosylase